MLQVVTYLKDPHGTQFRGLARPPKGVLLEGDPGVGKTLIAKAIAGEAGVPFFQVCFQSAVCPWLCAAGSPFIREHMNSSAPYTHAMKLHPGIVQRTHSQSDMFHSRAGT